MKDTKYAIQQFQQALEATPEDHPERAGQLASLGNGYRERYLRTGVEIDLELAIQNLQQALEATPEDHPERAGRLQSLGNGYRDRYLRTGAETDLELAIQHHQQALEATPEDHPERAGQLASLGNGYRDRYLRTGAETDLELAIQHHQQALEATPEDHPERAGRLQSLGNAYGNRYRRTGAEQDLELAIQHLQQALEATPEDHPERAGRLQSLGNAYGNRYRRTGAEQDLELAIQHLQQALEATPENHPERAGRLQYLGIGYGSRYQRTGADQDLELAIQHLQQALEATSKDHPEQASRLQYLGIGYGDRYKRNGAVQDLELAIQHLQQALEATPENHPDRADRLQYLGIGYGNRYQRTSAEQDLELAIQHFQQALEATPENYSAWNFRLECLEYAFYDRYVKKRAQLDLELAIHISQQVFDATPEDHPDRARRYHCLGVLYRDIYQRTGGEAHLQLAIRQFQQALDTTPEDHRKRADRLESLGTVYHDRYGRTGAETDLELAIQHFQYALDATPENHPDRAGRLQYLGVGYDDRYRRTRADQDIELAIQHLQQALEATPADHPERAGRFESLGVGYHDRYQRTGTETDLELAIRQYECAVRHPSSPVVDRIRPGASILNLHAEAEDWSSAHQIALIVTSLIAHLTPDTLDISDKQYLLRQLSGLASDAAAITLMAGKTPYEALELLELGRGVITGSIHEMRADVSDLLQHHPMLGAEYIELRDQLNAPTRQLDRLDMGTVITHQVNQRHSASRKLDQTIQTIRRLPSFDRFLMAPSEDEIQAAAASGPIIIINVSNFRCDALIVENHGIKSIPLPSLQKSDIKDHEATLARPEALDTQLLEWLWDAIANPVLDALGLTRTPDGCWPRIWWILTGALAKFPIHAAGYHYHWSETVLDRAISSYSSSVRALSQNRQGSSTLAVEMKLGKAVLVSMERTPGFNDLPFVPLEMNNLERLCGLLQVQICQPRPCREDVLSALNDCDIFHFAGHGETDQIDPSRSSLVLDNERLALVDLFETNLHDRKPFLAYLSACGTGQMKHDGLIDEALHLIAGYQIAGFRHVIGTLWEVNDETCVDVATMLYSCLKERNMTDDSVSEGLHRASRKLRDIWISEETTRSARRMAVLQDEDASTTMKQIRSCQGKERKPRDADQDKESSLNWIPYVHFGI